MKKVFLIILCVFWMGFIFYNSSNDGTISNEKSYSILNYLKNEYHNLKQEKKISTNNESSNTNIKSSNKLNKTSSNKKEESLNLIIRKNAHAFEYCVLGALVSYVVFLFNLKGRGAIIYIMFICLFYAVTDEFHQMFVPGRSSLVSDVLIDFAGSLLGILAFYIIYYKVIKRTLWQK